MKLRSRKSEYQHCFASPNKDYFKNIYEEQLAYRLKRREKEHCHYVLKWDSESSEESNESSGEKTPVVAEASGDGKKVFEILENTNLSKQDKGIATSPPHTAATENSVSIQTQTGSRSCAKSYKTNKPKEKNNEKPPFISYGWADDQMLSGRKKTHNILAPKKSVYPAALQRSSYLKQEKLKQKQKNERRCASAASIPLYQKPSDTSGWQSEYQRCYSSQSSRPSSAFTHKKRDAKSRSSRPKSLR